jgi:MinD superfamily P-loop ATPase
MHEMVIISGKGGTGKTSITASFAVLAGQSVIADCDVDAADLHLILSPRIKQCSDFYSGHKAVINQEKCVRCGACLAHCRFDAVKMDGKEAGEAIFTIDLLDCEGCGVCVWKCPVNGIEFKEHLCGKWMVSETRCGILVHAKLGIASDNSGKLVSTVRREARNIAEETGVSLILVDGPPGLGCPVIASVTGSSSVIIVTEPTCSGEHDLERVLRLTRHFNIPTGVCVNKWDINPVVTERIEQITQSRGAMVLGRIRYDRSVTQAQIEEKAVVELDSPAAEDIRKIWEYLMNHGVGGGKTKVELPAVWK